MNKAFKGGNALWIVVSLICLLSAAALLFFMLQEKDKRIQTEQKLTETEKAKRAVEIKLDHTQLELIQLKDQARLLETQIAEEKKNYQSVLTELEKKDTQIRELESNLTNEKKQRTNLANELAQLKENHDNLEGKLKEANLKVEELNQQLAEPAGKAGVELKKIVVESKKSLSGKVLVVNKEFHFVVIDLGKKDEVSVGDEFVVYQNSQEVGKVRIEKIYDAMSSAVILPGSQEHLIMEDSIVQSL